MKTIATIIGLLITGALILYIANKIEDLILKYKKHLKK